MSTPYTVKPGDTLSGIARKNGFKSWHEIYDDPENQAFRAKRPNPNLIYPGDVLLLPGKSSPCQVHTQVGPALRLGDRGEEVRRLQHNLNEALGPRCVPLAEDGIAGVKTEAAVRSFQKLFKLCLVDGIVGPETRVALATRVVIITGTITGQPAAPPNPPGPPQKVNPQPQPPSDTPSNGTGVKDSPVKDAEAPKSAWLIQGQPVYLWTPPPWAFYDPKGGAKPDYSIHSGGVSMGFVYQTRTEGPHWEFGGAGQFVFNSRTQATDPRYTLQLQGQATYADPISGGPFHSAIFGQVAGSYNIKPDYWVLGGGLGVQASVDIIENRWNLFAQGVLAGQWTLDGPGRGQFMLAPGVTIGTTVQWKLGD